jgi:hypothetical protein
MTSLADISTALGFITLIFAFGTAIVFHERNKKQKAWHQKK